MPFLETKQSGPDVPDGSDPMILTAIKADPQSSDPPRHFVHEGGVSAGKALYSSAWRVARHRPGHPPPGTKRTQWCASRAFSGRRPRFAAARKKRGNG